MDILGTIISASFILVVGLFGGLIGYFPNFSDKIKEYLKKEEDIFSFNISKASAEEIVKMKNLPSNLPDNELVPQLTNFSKKINDNQLELIKRREIIKEPSLWLKDLKRGICSAILLFLASGTLGLSYYNTYAPPIFAFGVVCIVFGLFKFYQITDRIAP